MNEVTIKLAPAPNSKKSDFLATLEPIPSLPIPSNINVSRRSRTDDEEDLPFEITLDNYTRDSWSLCQRAVSAPGHDAIHSDGKNPWIGRWMKITDEKNKFLGFLNYLKERKKSAFGSFDSPYPDESSGETIRAIMVVPFDPPPIPPPDLLEKENVTSDKLVFVKYCLDKKIFFQNLGSNSNHQQNRQMHVSKGFGVRDNASVSNTTTQRQKSIGDSSDVMSSNLRKGKSAGLLGNLLGASRRTNQHLNIVPSKKKKEDNSSSQNGPQNEPGSNTLTQSSIQVISSFRSMIEKKLLHFQSSFSLHSLKIPISLADYTRSLSSMEEKAKITMETLKFIIYEQVEEIDESWVAHKEQSGFMDEAIVVVYKEGHVPSDVLEDLNKGEVPDEIRMENRALQEAMVKDAARKVRAAADQMEIDAALRKANNKSNTNGQDSLKILNTKKRDRRTIEEIQRDMIKTNKKQKE